MTQTGLTRRSPVSPLEAAGTFFNGIDQAFWRRFFEPFRAAADWTSSISGFVPTVDVMESAESYVVSAELPGLKKDDVEITLENQTLVLTGERRFEGNAEATPHRRERSYGRFMRTFYLPKVVDTAKVKASFKDGILTVTVPKAPEARAQRIAIN